MERNKRQWIQKKARQDETLPERHQYEHPATKITTKLTSFEKRCIFVVTRLLTSRQREHFGHELEGHQEIPSDMVGNISRRSEECSVMVREVQVCIVSTKQVDVTSSGAHILPLVAYTYSSSRRNPGSRSNGQNRFAAPCRGDSRQNTADKTWRYSSHQGCSRAPSACLKRGTKMRISVAF